MFALHLLISPLTIPLRGLWTPADREHPVQSFTYQTEDRLRYATALKINDKLLSSLILQT